MTDRNNKAEEDYLDSLLRSLTGETKPEEKENTEEEVDIPEKDLDTELDVAVGTDGSDEQFLSEFEKEFFDGEDENIFEDIMERDEISKLADVINQQNDTIEDSFLENIELGNEIQNVVREADEDVHTELFESVPDVREEEPENQEETKVKEEKEETNVKEESKLEIPDEKLFDVDSDILGAIDEAVSEGVSSDSSNQSEAEKNIVEEAISKADSSVEEDLQGLYDILGEEKPKKKKGLFSRKEKKEKKEKKSKKDKEKEQELQETQEDNAALSEDEIDINSLFGVDQSSETAEIGDPSEFDFGLDESGTEGSDGEGETPELEFGLDETEFNDLDENERLIQQMDDGEFDEEELLEDDEGADKKKKKKEKKEKKEKKKKKEKAPKKKKPKKEKKPKAPKEPDVIIKVPIVFWIFALSFVIVAVFAAKLGGEYYYYNQQFFEAVSLYVYGNELEEGEVLDQDKYESKFNDAYTLIRGLEMKTKDHQAFYDQLETIMIMDRHYEAYKSYMMMDDYEHGLDSLVKAVKMYDKYQNKARDLKCFDEMTLVLGWVDEKLSSTYGISTSQARELHMIEDDDEYAIKVRTIAASARAAHKNDTDGEE